ncbi:hypothetical protein [Plantactinospora sp. CA-290183]|uniref:hypothetical protein n=1 Tax=Plantactinospora sp. CA-290183 TaxID=3240006 RepID=UPI003D8D6D74
MSTWSLIGRIHDNGYTFDAVPFDAADQPEMVSWLRWMWADMFDSKTDEFIKGMLRQGRDSATASRPAKVQGDLRSATSLNVAEWLYLIDPRTEQILVYEATIHDRWLHHSMHPLRTLPHNLPIGSGSDDPESHWWRPAAVGLRGQYMSWPVRILESNRGQGQIIVKLDLATLSDILTVTFTLDLDRADGMPDVGITADGTVTVTWYPGTDHEQVQRITADANEELVIGPHILPWTLPEEQVLDYDFRTVSAVGPVRRWVSQDEFRTQHPDIPAFPLSTICAAIIGLSPHAPAVLGTNRTPHVVWLVAPTHALMVTPTFGDGRPGRGGVALPRPLAGTWAADPNVAVLSPLEVTAACLNLHHLPS